MCSGRGQAGWVWDRMLRISQLPSESEGLGVPGEQGPHSCLDFRQHSAPDQHFPPPRMELSAAKAPSAADVPEIVSRPYICLDCYVCIFCSLFPDYFGGQEGGVMGNQVLAQPFPDGATPFPTWTWVPVFLFVVEGNFFPQALLCDRSGFWLSSFCSGICKDSEQPCHLG